MLEMNALGLQVRKMLGSGSFAQVYHCYDRKQQNQYAVKAIRKDVMTNSRVRAFAKEAEILASLEHRNVVKFHSFEETEQNLLIRMELIRGGTLKRLMEQRKAEGRSFSDVEVSQFIRHLLQGIRYLHSLNIIHRDLKPGKYSSYKTENILFEDNNDLSTCKIVDFGLSAKLELHNPTNVKAQCGTLLYMAPEVFNRPSYTKAVDIWAAAVIMYMLFHNGAHPFYTQGMRLEDFKMKLKNAHFPLLSNPQAQNFIERISKREYEQRYNASQALKHPWITRNFDDEIPLSIHQSYKGFDSSNHINQVLKLYLTLAVAFPHRRVHIDEAYRFKINDFVHNNEAVRVMSPSRRRVRDKNNELFTKMKQIFNYTGDCKEGKLENELILDDSPTLKKHQSYFLSLFQREKSFDLSRPASFHLQLQRPQSHRQTALPNLLHETHKLENSSNRSDDFSLNLSGDRIVIEHEIKKKIQMQIEESVIMSLKQSSRPGSSGKRRIFQKKPSIDQKQSLTDRKNIKLLKKFSQGYEVEKSESISKATSNFTLSTKQIYNRRAMSPLKACSKPMAFTVVSKNSHRK